MNSPHAKANAREDTSPEVIVTNLKKRLSGVTTTVTNLLPAQAVQLRLAYVGPRIPGVQEAEQASPEFVHLSFWQALKLSMKKLPDGRKRIWHVRRDHEQVIVLLLRALLRLPIHIVFTSAATRQHGGFTLWLIGKMDAVIATTPVAASMIQSAQPRHLRVIPHGVNTQEFTPPPNKAQLWQEASLPGRYGVGIFGRVRHQKGIHIFVPAMIRVMQQHTGAVAVICGLCKSEDEAYKQALVEQIAQAGLTERFLWLGMVPNEEVLQWYRRVSITVACPLNEGFGLTPIEGMACGSAVVASRTGAFEEIVVEGETGHLVPTDDVDALAQALAKLMSDEARMAEMGRLGRLRVEQHYSIEAEARRIGEVYSLLK
jgi:mannosyltransferase